MTDCPLAKDGVGSERTVCPCGRLPLSTPGWRGDRAVLGRPVSASASSGVSSAAKVGRRARPQAPRQAFVFADSVGQHCVSHSGGYFKAPCSAPGPRFLRYVSPTALQFPVGSSPPSWVVSEDSGRGAWTCGGQIWRWGPSVALTHCWPVGPSACRGAGGRSVPRAQEGRKQGC